MLTVETRHAVHQDHARTMDTAALRRNFLADNMFAEGEIRLIYTHYDRFVMGGAVPAGGELVLDVVAETRTPSFLDRRELGVVNIGDTGTVAAFSAARYVVQRRELDYWTGPVAARIRREHWLVSGEDVGHLTGRGARDQERQFGRMIHAL